MSRNMSRVYTLTGRLVAETPLHIGGVDAGDPMSDMPLAVDGQGRYYIPGTSLAGALRQWMSSGGEDEIHALWGFQDGDKGLASLFTVEDAVVEGDVVSEVRDGVGIDAGTGTASSGIKYNTTILPRGTSVQFTCSLGVPRGEDVARAEAAVKMLTEALQHASIRLGSQRTRGMGKVVLKDDKLRCAILDTRQGMIDHLRGHDSEILLESLASGAETASRRIDISIQWHTTAPMMVKSGVSGIAIDSLPLVSGVDGGQVALTVPGSSLKGVLRSRATLIVNTVAGGSPDKASHEAGKLVAMLFGSSRADKDKDPEVGGMGMLSVDDCYAKDDAVKRDAWAQVEAAIEEADVRSALADSALDKKLSTAAHVAIDRWLGGASDKKLFTQMEPRDLKWEPMHFTLDLLRLEDKPEKQKQMMALLLLTLRDLAAGRVPLGFATNRGMGDITVDSITLVPAGVDWMKEALTLEKGDIGHLPQGLLEELGKAWQKAVVDHEGGV
ncbi:MAG: RAMP superfamily CRISPR-associated protein [Candidatus Cryosericum sp.]